MKIGIPRETKDQEGRVARTPGAVRQLKVAGHEVRVETQAGVGAGFSDEEYVNAGTGIVSVSDALANNPGFGKAFNTYQDHLTPRTVAEDLGMLDRYQPYIPAI